MSVLVDSLKKQNAFLQDEVERFGRSVDSLSARLADALTRLREHDPVYVAQALGEPVPEPTIPSMDSLPPSQTDNHPD